MREWVSLLTHTQVRIASIFLKKKKESTTTITDLTSFQRNQNREYSHGENGIVVTCKLISVAHYLSFFFRERNNTWALARAKANVVRWYPVVGILDYMEESLNAFALEFPYFFKGAARIYEQFRKYRLWSIHCIRVIDSILHSRRRYILVLVDTFALRFPRAEGEAPGHLHGAFQATSQRRVPEDSSRARSGVLSLVEVATAQQNLQQRLMMQSFGRWSILKSAAKLERCRSRCRRVTRIQTGS